MVDRSFFMILRWATPIATIYRLFRAKKEFHKIGGHQV
jgi:hypothetical protein